MKYVDVILPLGFEGLLTYSVPRSMEHRVQPFVRALVPLGRSKVYTGLIVCGRDEAPSAGGKDVEVKDVIDIVDDVPSLLPWQYRLWQWMADYYMCPVGDVFSVAFPAGMKQEEGYRPKTETYVRLTEPFRTESALHVALNMLNKADRQRDAFANYLTLSHYDTLNGSETEVPVAQVTREELQNVSKCTAATVKALIDRRLLETYEVEVGRLSREGTPHPELLKPLSPAQQRAYDEICGGMPRYATEGTADGTKPAPPSKPVLLQGVTGSGKTEIYIRMIQDCIDRGEQVLYLLPEIALTVQMTTRLHRVFGNRLGIYHSRYSDAERVEVWRKQLSDTPFDIILGARSAVFLPFRRLGLIIIDEEHETSFKQQDPAPRYHARSVAMMMARLTGTAPDVVLGTATPSVESFFNAVSGKYRLVQLTERYKGIELPSIDVVDTGDLRRRKMMYGAFSPQLVEAMRDALQGGRQVILFQNRRGFAPVIECHDCGWTPKCKNCDVTLTMHKTTGQLTCHYCGYTYAIPLKCPSCFCTDLRERGCGTEKVEEQLLQMEKYFLDDGNAQPPDSPAARHALRIARMDLDTTRTRNAYERIIGEFSAGRTNVLIGTQMVSKGLDFSNVSVVGILNADTMINHPDFRAYEHAFQMMAQVAGRAGRKGSRGRVILQTKKPDLPVISYVRANNYRAFFDEQCEERRLFAYPPYTRLVYVYLRHSKEPLVESAAVEMGGRLRHFFGKRVLGPDKPPVARVKRMCIRKIVLKLETGIDLQKARQCMRYVRDAIMQDKRYASLHVYFDVDPV